MTFDLSGSKWFSDAPTLINSSEGLVQLEHSKLSPNSHNIICQLQQIFIFSGFKWKCYIWSENCYCSAMCNIVFGTVFFVCFFHRTAMLLATYSGIYVVRKYSRCSFMYFILICSIIRDTRICPSRHSDDFSWNIDDFHADTRVTKS